MVLVDICVEGLTDEAVVKRIVEHVGLIPGTVYGYKGKRYLLQKLPAYNRAAQFSPWITVVDLDQDADCAPNFIRDTLPAAGQGMRLRVAVRAVESWLMADDHHLAAFLGISSSLIPANPDAEPNPKVTLVNLAQRSRRKAIRLDMVPRPGSGASVGPGYVSRIIEFVTSSNTPWRIDVAAAHSDSLRRCIAALVTFRTWGSTS